MAANLIIRADASTIMGTGHVMRCLALAQAWKDAGGSVIFAMAAEMPVIECRLKGDGFVINRISAKLGSERDAALTADLAISLNACFVVVDGYYFSAEYQERLKKEELNLLFIDDYGHAKCYCADLVLNQNISAREELYRERDPSTELLLGSQFVLFRKEFQNWCDWQRNNPEIAVKILVSLGGSDSNNVTLKILEALQGLTSHKVEMKVVAGCGNSHISELEAASKESHFSTWLVRNVSNMPELMAWADMAIISGGTTSYETAFMGLPSMITVIAENQVQVAEKLADIGAAVNLGWYHKLTGDCIKKEALEMMVNWSARVSMSRISRQIVDGRGTSRVIRAMLERVITVREAIESDSKLIHEWANNNETRAASFNTGFIDWDAHCNWFSERLSDPNCIFLICGNGKGDSLGLVRFDLAADEAVMSINLDPRARGRGLASFIIIRTVAELFRRYNISKVSAFIKPQSLRSARAFERAGFSIKGPCNVRGNEARHYMMINDDLV